VATGGDGAIDPRHLAFVDRAHPRRKERAVRVDRSARSGHERWSASLLRPRAGSTMHSITKFGAALALAALTGSDLCAQSSFGSGCAGASGVTPTLAVTGVVRAGQPWTLDVAAPGGLGLGYLLVGSSNAHASVLGGLALPLDLGQLFADPLWVGCALNVDTNLVLQPYVFDPHVGGGHATFTLPGWDFGTLYFQAVNIDPDFATRIAGVSRGLAVRRTPPNGMVPINPGTFDMGSNAPSIAPYFGSSSHKPVHTVTISYPFWMGRHEVTQAEFLATTGINPSLSVGPQLPVDSVSWDDAVTYCALLTAAEALSGALPAGYEYRLPTEAEWEYACRAGTTTEFNVGEALECENANFDVSLHSGVSCQPTGTVPVGSYAPNAWGLHDMHGNVREWCLDSFAPYAPGAVTDPVVTGGATRVIRGGSWDTNSAACRSARRSSIQPGQASDVFGFRVVLAPIIVP
jgi:formylglycine-generating enzyme required for sulfatase activity